MLIGAADDATDNLLGSLIIAGHFAIPEVALYFNYKVCSLPKPTTLPSPPNTPQLFRGNRSTKISATSYDAFASPNLPPLATITSTGAHVRWDLILPFDPSRTFRVQQHMHTASVAYVRVFPGITPHLLRTILSHQPTRGLVLETFGAGNIPHGPENGLLGVLAEAVSRGVVVVNITQCLSGNVSPLYKPARELEDAGVLCGYDLTAEAALTKLSCLLGREGSGEGGIGREEVKRLMGIALRGELTRGSGVWFERPIGVGGARL